MVDYKYARVKDVMSTPVHYIDAMDTVQEALNKMKSAGVKKGIILDQGKVIGHTDSWKLRLTDMGKKVKDAIHEKENIYYEVKMVSQEKPLNEIVDELRNESIKVVTDEKGNNIGVITPLDLLKVRTMGLRL